MASRRVERLRAYAASLRKGPPGESRSAARERLELRAEARRRIDEIEAAQARYEALDDPAVLALDRSVAKHSQATKDAHKVLTSKGPGWVDAAAAPVEEDEPAYVSPAVAALARTAEERRHEQAWANDYDEEGWAG